MTGGLRARGEVTLLPLAGAQATLLGACAVADGYYDFSAWAPLALASAVATIVVLVVQPPRLAPAARLALGGLVGLTAWAALSMLWAESVDRAWTEANRFGLYAITLLVGLALVRSARHARAVVAVLTAALGLTVLWMTVQLATGEVGDMFVNFRLTEPMGYANGLAALLLMGVWAFVAVAEGPAHPALRGAGLALAVLAGDLVVLTQSRSTLPALALSVVVVLVVLPGRVARGWALLVALASVLAATPRLLDVYGARGEGPTVPADSLVHDAMGAGIVAALLGGLAWGAACALAPRVRSETARRGAGAALVALLAAGLLAGAAAADRPVERVRTEYRNFVDLKVQESARQRFSSGGGYRYDYWRIAARQFSDRPLLGVGAGNYDRTYFLERRNPENVRQPHSLQMQVLGELGLPGALALLAFLAGAGWGVARVRRPPPEAGERGPLVAAVGILVLWGVYTSVDWLHNIPGVTGIALLAAAILLARLTWVEGEPEPGPGPERFVRASVALFASACALALLAGSVGRQYVADRYRSQARDRVAEEPAEALRSANRALRLNADSMEAHYVKAAAYARLDQYAASRATLREAAAREPHNFVPHVLLGDLAVRRGDLAQAARDYRRAAELNPRDRSLAALAADPGSAAPAAG